MQSQQGVLWKRRDVFKNRWRPRWFILQPDQGLLTYYLLASSSVNDTIAGASPSRLYESSAMTNPARERDANRNRTTSFDSSITENTINYDVIPRGTIFLLNCKVLVNEGLTNVRERLYIFTIESPPNTKETKVHLAARSAQVRDAWILHISRVCESLSAAATPAPRSPPRLRAAAPLRSGPRVTNTAATDNSPVNSVVEVPASEIDAIESPAWSSVDESSNVYANVSASLKARIEREIAMNLAFCNAMQTPDENDWQKLYVRSDGSAAYQKRNAAAQPMILTMTQLDQPVKQVFNLLVDPSRRHEFEANARQCERLQVLSPHTFFDYYSYNAVWPSRPREFAVAVHWQILQNNDDQKAIAIVAFSWDEASALKPIRDNVRATIFVNFTLLRQTGPNTCHATRVLSYTLGGSIPSALSTYIIAQQVGSTRAVGERLSRYEAVPAARLKGPLTRESIIEDVIQRIGTEAADALLSRQNSGDDDLSLVLSDSDRGAHDQKRVPLVVATTILLCPLLLYHTAIRLATPYPGLCFLASAFLVARQLVLLHYSAINTMLDSKVGGPVTGSITCRFKVDLKGVLRFLANRKEERQPGSSDVSVVHIVARACAVALKKHQLHTKHLHVPFLLIDKYVPCGVDDHVSVSLVLEPDSSPVTVALVDEKSVHEVADAVEKMRHNLEPSRDLGSCLVLASHNFDDSDIETDAVAVHPGVNLVAVIGSVALDRAQYTPKGLAASPRPTLQLSLTTTSEKATFSSSCRLAEEIQKLIMYPEICDDS
ncbi:hypothetical protein MPSEU_000783000 [Mayamaea pseudoterrestris]|nr:hypothetical protein MPSEU_000783000 [Mayamaea pseudoterrestris]